VITSKDSSAFVGVQQKQSLPLLILVPSLVHLGNEEVCLVFTNFLAHWVKVFRCSSMSKATTIKEALKRWEEREQQNSLTAKNIDLQFQWPPIEKMDSTLGTLVQCE